ncbi:unnamed protein product, partial [Rotaria socialis]
MNSNSLNKTLLGSMKCTRLSSSTLISNKHKTNSLLTSCCGCSRTREQSKSIDKYGQSENGTTTPKEDTKCDVHKGFFKRIQYFKAQKRQSTARKQQLAAAATISATRSTSPISNGHSIIEPERLLNDSDEHSSNIISSSSCQHKNESFINNNYSHHPMRNSQSIPLLLNR